MEIKNNRFSFKELDATDTYYRFSGYASTFGNIDQGSDVVVNGAFLKSISLRKPKMLWQHDPTDPIGFWDVVKEDGHGLYVEGCIRKGTQRSEELHGYLLDGIIDAMSIGYTTIDFEMDSNVRKLKELDLWEISLVTFPMNESAKVTSVKSVVPYKDLPIADKGTSWSASLAEKRIKEFTGSSENPSASYKNAFLWYDSENAENFGSYKLPIADVISGKLMAVPKAIQSAAAAIHGARGGVNIPESDRSGVIANINKYYKKMGEDSPLEKSFSSVIERIENIREIEEFLKDFGFSSNESKSLISIIRDVRDADSCKDRDDSWVEINSQLDELKQLLAGKING